MSKDAQFPWPTLPLGEIAAEMCLGKMLDKAKNRGTLQPYLRNVNVRWFAFDFSDMKEMRFEDSEGERFQLRANDLVICEGGEPGRCAVWTGLLADAKIQKALHRVRFRPDEYDPHFAMYYLYFGTLSNHFAARYTGTTIKHLTGAALSQVPFPIPPLAEQRRIVVRIEKLFAELDAAVEELEQVRTNLKRYRAAVLKAAVTGDLTADWRAAHPNAEPASVLLDRIIIDRREKWEADQLAKFAADKKTPPKNWQVKYAEPSKPDTSKLPALPAGWCWAAVEQLGVVQLGRQRSPGNESKNYPTKYIRAANITEAGIDVSDVLEMEFTPKERVTFTLRPGDLILSEASGSPDQVGKPAIWRDELPDCCFQNTVIRLRPEQASSEFLLVVFQQFYRGKVFARLSGGVGINHLSASKFSTIPIPLPPLAEQEAIVLEVETRLSDVTAAEAVVNVNLTRAARLRQSILKEAFAGRLVPQDPADEPAAVLLERIKAGVDEATLGLFAFAVSGIAEPSELSRTKVQKFAYLMTAHHGYEAQVEFGSGKAGPFSQAVADAEGFAVGRGYFTTYPEPKDDPNLSAAVRFTPGPNLTAGRAIGLARLGEQKDDAKRLLDHIRQMTTPDAELLGTVYAVWNGLLLDEKSADDDAIIAGVHGWHESKKKYTPEVIRDRIAWMRANGYVPTGHGRRTEPAKAAKPKRGRKKKAPASE